MIYLVFASIYTPTLIFLSHCCFSFSCGKYTTFFFNCILFGRFFFKEISKREARSLIRGVNSLLYIYSTFANKFNIIFSTPISTSPKEAYNEKKTKNIKAKPK